MDERPANEIRPVLAGNETLESIRNVLDESAALGRIVRSVTLAALASQKATGSLNRLEFAKVTCACI